MRKTAILPLLPLLALCLVLLAGCGAEKAPAPAQESAAPELEWSAVFQETALPAGSEAEVWALTSDGAYAACRETLAKGEAPEGKTADYEGQYDVKGWRLYRVAADGGVTALGYELAETPSRTPEDAAGRKNYSASAQLEGLLALPDGGLLAVEALYESWYPGAGEQPEHTEDYWRETDSRSSYTLCRLDAEGQVLSRAALDFDGDYLDLRSAAVDGEGRLYLPSNEQLLVCGPDGQCLAELDAGYWIFGAVRLRDGRVAVETYRNGMVLLAADIEKQELTELGPAEYADTLLDGAGDWDYFALTGTKLCGCRIAERETQELLELLDCDLSAQELTALRAAEDGSLRGVFREESRDAKPASLVTLRQTPRDPARERKELTLGTLSAYSISDAVLRFNRSQDAVRIRVRDYSDYVEGEDYEAGLTKLVTEIMAGDMPDLLALDNLPYAQLAAKGLLEDLYPRLDADAELSREDFFPNVLHSMEVGSRLCQASPGFTIVTVMGASEVVGDTPGWTYDAYYAALASMPEGCTAFGPMGDRDNLLEMCTYLNLDSFVDWSEHRCDFENEDFIRMLEFCASFPEPGTQAYDEESSDMLRIAEEQQMLVLTTLYDLDSAVYNDQYFAGSSTYIGLPTGEGVGNMLMPSSGVGMSSRCADKDAAWLFLRAFFTRDYQLKSTRYGIGLPLNREAFRILLDKAMEVEYEKDAEGHELLDANGEKIPAAKGGMSVSMGNEAVMEFKLWAMTPEQAAKLTALVEGTTKTVDLNTSLFGIIRGEAGAYFAGQKTAEETAHLIQSKASLYLSEQG